MLCDYPMIFFLKRKRHIHTFIILYTYLKFSGWSSDSNTFPHKLLQRGLPRFHTQICAVPAGGARLCRAKRWDQKVGEWDGQNMSEAMILPSSPIFSWIYMDFIWIYHMYPARNTAKHVRNLHHHVERCGAGHGRPWARPKKLVPIWNMEWDGLDIA